jgi:hypothetical protein
VTAVSRLDDWAAPDFDERRGLTLIFGLQMGRILNAGAEGRNRRLRPKSFPLVENS